ncbi:hypothetical protein HDE_08402 [Halotydeus destructor]|nr:hypothetical protein HDE_08402 [Halotydeus destructor]
MMDTKQMPTTYKVGRIILAVQSGLALYSSFLSAVFILCALPGAARQDASVALGMSLALVVNLVLGVFHYTGFRGAVHQHRPCLVVYASIYFGLSLVLLAVSVSFQPAMGFFVFVVINTWGTMIPAHMAERIKNAHQVAPPVELVYSIKL